MRSSVILPQFFLPHSAIKLGRLVTNVKEPHQDYFDPSPGEGLPIIAKVESNYDSTDTLEGHTSFASELTAFLSTSVSRRTKSAIRITSNQLKTYYLDNTARWFRDVVQSEDVRKWIERVKDEGEDIYIVVGYYTAMNASIVEQSQDQNGFDGKLAIPLSHVLAASGVMVPCGDLVDPRLAGSHGRAEDLQRHFVAQGEQVIAVQYRKVCFRFFSSKNVDKATLSKEARWKRYDRPRYLENDDEDMVEVSVEEEFSLKDHGDMFETESGEIFFST